MSQGVGGEGKNELQIVPNHETAGSIGRHELIVQTSNHVLYVRNVNPG